MAVASKFLADQVIWYTTRDHWDCLPEEPVQAPKIAEGAPPPEVGVLTTLALGAAAVAAKNPVVSRRFWGRR